MFHNLSCSVADPFSLFFSFFQGAAIGAAFADLFPQLVGGKVALIASAGLLEVSHHFLLRNI